jgi:hypothetical protein
MDMMGLDRNTDPGKWLPVTFKLGVINMCKLTSEDPDMPTYGCTTLFVYGGDTFIIDTPYREFQQVFEEFNNQDIIDTTMDNDIII